MSEAVDKKWWEILAVLTPLIIGIGVTGVGAYFTYTNNVRQLDMTDKNNNKQLQLNQLSILDKLCPRLISTNIDERTFAYNALRIVGYEEMADKLIIATKDPAGRPIFQAIKESSNETDAVKAKAKEDLSSIPVLIYMQLASTQQKEGAEDIRASFSTDHYTIPNIGAVVGTPPKTTEVRYFNKEDESVADDIVKVLKNKGVKAQKSLVSHYEAKKGNLEIWFSPNTFL